MAASPTFAAAPKAASPAAATSTAGPTAMGPVTQVDNVRSEGIERRGSLQFKQTVGLPSGSPKPSKSGKPGSYRMASPPPPPLFRPRVSFDTFEKPADFIKETSFTLNKKHKDYEYTKRSRTFLCGFDAHDYSDYALEWLIEELVDDGDEIVCLRVVEKDDSLAGKSSMEAGRYRSEAEKLMARIEEKNIENKAINLILEFAVGKVQSVIDDMIKLYEPAILIVGTRGRAKIGFEGLLPGSVSKYCLQHSPVPVIVVRPNAMRVKNKRKRLLDPERHSYRDILDKSGPSGHVLDRSNRNSMIDVGLPVMDADAEAAAVLAAVGYRGGHELRGSPLTKVESAGTDVTLESSALSGRTPSPEDLRSLARVMKSPDLQNLDSPALSNDSSFGDSGDDVGEDAVGKHDSEDPSPLTGPVEGGVAVESGSGDKQQSAAGKTSQNG